MPDAKGFLIVTCKIDPRKKGDLKHYLAGAGPIFAQHDGHAVGQWAVAETNTGESQTTHIIIMEFPSQNAIRGALEDPKYIELIPSRTQAFPVLDIMIAEAFEPASLLG